MEIRAHANDLGSLTYHIYLITAVTPIYLYFHLLFVVVIVNSSFNHIDQVNFDFNTCWGLVHAIMSAIKMYTGAFKG